MMSDKLTVMQRTTLARLQSMVGQLADMGVTLTTCHREDGGLRGLILFDADPLGLFSGAPLERPADAPRLRVYTIRHNGLRLVLSQTDEEDDG